MAGEKVHDLQKGRVKCHPPENLKDLFLHTLKDVYYAEKQLHKTLPKLAKKASD